jgi:hypothetical protein
MHLPKAQRRTNVVVIFLELDEKSLTFFSSNKPRIIQKEEGFVSSRKKVKEEQSEIKIN